MRNIFNLGMVGLLFSVSVLSGVGEASTLSLNGTFSHQDQNTNSQYQTIISAVHPFEFNTQSGQAILNVSAGDCFSLSSWVVGPNEPQVVGPARICVAESSVSAQALNGRLQRGDKAEALPDLSIPLVPDVNAPPDHWTNTIAVDGRVFIKACGSESFTDYGKLVFGEGSVSVTSMTDAKGETQLDIGIQQVILEVGQTAWNTIREQCDNGRVLSETSLTGTSETFSATTQLAQPDPNTWFGGIYGVQDQIKTLSYQGGLNENDADKLHRFLGHTSDDLKDAKLNGAIRWLDNFDKLLSQLQRRGLIDLKTALALSPPLEEVRAGIGDRFSSLVEPDAALYCEADTTSCSDETCFPGAYYVDRASTSSTPDGNPSRPFLTISDALAAAELAGHCGAIVFVAPGMYTAGEINVSMDLYVLAMETGAVTINGSFVNSGPHLLDLRGVRLVGGGVVASGAIDVDHACAVTNLQDVSIRWFQGHGLRQRGGSVNLFSSDIARTTNDSTSLTSGSGLKVGCGANVNLVDVTLWHNDSAGLVSYGEGTRVNATNLGISSNGPAALVDSAGKAYVWGALYVGYDAEFTGRSVYVDRNEMQTSVLAAAGGTINIDGGIVTQARSLPASVPSLLGAGGMGVSALGRHSQAHIQNFEISHSDLCGVLIAQAGEVTLADGVVSNNAIGACVHVPGYPLWLLQNRVGYLDNVTNFESASFSIPEPSGPVSIDD